MNQDGNFTDRMIELEPGSECDLFRHYIIPPGVWKSVVGREVKDGEYQYWHWAPWQVGIGAWDSVRDWVASCVEKVEGMVERGEKCNEDEDEDEDAECDSEDSGSGEGGDEADM